MTMRHAHAQTFALARPAGSAGHRRRGPAFIKKHQPFGIEVELPVEPDLAPRQHVGPVLLGGMRSLFLSVMRCRVKKRHSVVWPSEIPCSASAARNSANVASRFFAKVRKMSLACASVRRERRSPPCCLRAGIALAPAQLRPADRAGGTDAEADRRLTAGRPGVNCRQHT